MGRINIIIICFFALIISSCAENFTDGAKEHVHSFYEVGCDTDFSNIYIERFGTSSYGQEAVRYMRCDNITYVTIEFFDNPSSEQPNNYRYFLVNGESILYHDVVNFSNTNFTFSVDPLSSEIPGTFYGIYRVTAVNQDNGSYTYKEYNITAHDKPVN